MSRLIRILSDIHFGHKASTVKSLDQLAPLTEQVDHLIFNGDTLEQKYRDSPLHESDPLPTFTQFSNFFEKRVPEVTYITGNHDPQVSSSHHCFLNSNEVFVTHGDAIFENITPWCGILKSINNALDKLGTPGSHQSLSERLDLTKRVTIEAHKDTLKHDPTVWGKFLVFAHQAWPPTKPFRVIKAWRDAPDKAVQLAKESALPSKFIVIGHTHFPGIWQRGEHIVINTGSYFPWPTRYAVDVEGSSLKIRKVVKKQGKFHPGRIIREFQLKQPAHKRAKKPEENTSVKLV